MATLAETTTPSSPSAGSSSALTADQARAVGVDAYLYFYPLITMDLTRKQSTNLNQPETGKGPANLFVNVPAYPPADYKGVVRSNFDTLYSIAWLDLTREPLVVSAPDTSGRYYLLPMLDMWTDVFASPGWRTTGTHAVNFLVTPPGWTGKVSEGFAHVAAPTPYVWIIGRTKTDGPSDYDAVHKIQAGYKVTPLSRLGMAPEAVTVKIDPTVDMKTPPMTQVDSMEAGAYFAYAAELLKLHPPHITDQPIIAQMKRIGIEPGKSFNISTLDPVVQKALQSAPADAQQLMKWKVPTIARVANFWSMNTDTMGVYGNYYLKRAMVTQLGLGANLPDDAIYPLNLGDAEGKPLDGANKYTIHFDKGATPPCAPSGPLPSTTPTDSRSTTYSIASPSAAGCLSSTTLTVHSTFISNQTALAKTRKQTGSPRRKARSISPCAYTRPRQTLSPASGIRLLYGAHRQLSKLFRGPRHRRYNKTKATDSPAPPAGLFCAIKVSNSFL